MRSAARVLALLWAYALGVAEDVPRIERWELHSSLVDVRAVASDGQRLWVATGGGLFTYEPTTGQLNTIRRTEGLLVHDFTAVAADSSSGLVLAGAFDGTLEQRTVARWEHVLDIRNQPGIPDKRITAIALAGERAYVGTAFGIVVVNLRTQTLESWTDRLGAFPPATAVTALALWGDSLWVGTAVGLAVVQRAAIRDPSLWRSVLNAPISALCVSGGGLVIATANQVWRYADGIAVLLRQYEQPVIGLACIGERLFVATSGELWQLLPVERQLSTPVRTLTGFWGGVVAGTLCLTLAAPRDGLWYWDERSGQWSHVRPNSPHTNLLLSCAIDSAGILWCATDRTAGEGFACLYRGRWYAFTIDQYPQLGVAEYHRVAVPPSGSGAWLASWGRGFLRVMPADTGFVLERYDVSTTPLRGIPSDTLFLPIGELAFDGGGTLWGVCHWCVTGALVQRNASDGAIRSLLTALPPNQRQNYPLVIDPWGTKWFGSLVGEGLFFFREALGTTSELWGRLTSSHGLPNTVVSALAVDRNGMIWVGTPSGLAVVLNPSAVLMGAAPVVRPVSLLRDQAVYGIAVDVSNNKWLATDAGLWVVNPEATAVLIRITAENSPLPSNQVRSVAIEHQTGRVVVATRAGLAVLTTSARLPQARYTLQCQPQPFVPERDAVLTIDGLAEQSIVQVLTLEGLLVARLQTQSRTAYWDGRNERGEIVPAGVYVISALSLASGETAQTKVLVLRP